MYVRIKPYTLYQEQPEQIFDYVRYLELDIARNLCRIYYIENHQKKELTVPLDEIDYTNIQVAAP